MHVLVVCYAVLCYAVLCCALLALCTGDMFHTMYSWQTLAFGDNVIDC